MARMLREDTTIRNAQIRKTGIIFFFAKGGFLLFASGYKDIEQGERSLFEHSIPERNWKMKHFFTAAALCIVLFCCCGCGGKENTFDTAWQYTDVAMGTVIQMNLYASDQDAAQSAADAVMELLRKVEQEQISWRLESSEVYRINESAGSERGILLSADMTKLLERSLELYERSGGLFDITLGPLTRLWNIDKWAAGQEQGDFMPPSEEAVEEALGRCGAGRLRLEPGSPEGEGMAYLPQGMLLDLGAVGKGYAQNLLRDMLEGEEGITGAVISLGGSVLTWGSKPDGSSFRIGIADPFHTSANAGILTLSGQWFISTSGDYERYVDLDGVRYHHILDPVTGYPADSGVRGVTILSREGTLCDALSTACFLLGPEKGMELAAEYDAEVLFILSDGRIVASEGMLEYFKES